MPSALSEAFASPSPTPRCATADRRSFASVSRKTPGAYRRPAEPLIQPAVELLARSEPAADLTKLFREVQIDQRQDRYDVGYVTQPFAKRSHLLRAQAQHGGDVLVGRGPRATSTLQIDQAHPKTHRHGSPSAHFHDGAAGGLKDLPLIGSFGHLHHDARNVRGNHESDARAGVWHSVCIDRDGNPSGPHDLGPTELARGLPNHLVGDRWEASVFMLK